MDQIIREADVKIESIETVGNGLEGTVRVPGQIVITSAPSDISSIHGNDEERDCHTPNSCSSGSGSESIKQKKNTPDVSVIT